MLLLSKYRYKGISKNSQYPSLMEKGRDEANKKKLFLEMPLS